MRQLSVVGEILIVILAQTGFCAQSQLPIPAGQLVREVVYNELNDHHAHGYWRYWVEHNTPKETWVEEQIETSEGPITHLTLSNGQPPSAQAVADEQARLQRLLTSPDEQEKHLREYEENENRIGRILALLPDAFLYDYDGDENGCYRLRFRPNPSYPAHSIEARIFHSMSGTLWVDARYKRLSRLEGHVQENLDFGYGILGRLYKGGWFQLERSQVSPTEWKTERLEIHMCGRALLVKSFARDTSEARGGFSPVPAGMNLAQGMALLHQIEARNQAPAQSGSSLVTSTTFALRR
jgi:hypothetical protein